MEYSVFDTHCDTLCRIIDENKNIDHGCEVSIEGMKKYKSYTQVMACFVAPKYKKTAYKRTRRLISAYHTDVEPRVPENVKTILSIEGGEGITDIEALREFYRLGVRLIAPTWNFSNHIASGAYETDSERGFTEFGAKLLREMDRLNMLIDVSHLNDRSFYDVTSLWKKPIIASHSCSRAVCEHRRNLTDDMFNMIRESGGCVGINFYPIFLNGTKTAGIDDIIRHIEHFMSLGGENNIGLGSDFDGTDGILPDGIGGAGDVYKIFDKLLQLNYTEEQINKISHANFERIFEKFT